MLGVYCREINSWKKLNLKRKLRKTKQKAVVSTKLKPRKYSTKERKSPLHMSYNQEIN